MAKIVVDVMLKPQIRDPQGEAIANACHRLGFGEVVAVRQGKRFEVELSDPAGTDPAGTDPVGADPAGAGPAGGGLTDLARSRVAELAAELLANPVIEEFVIRTD